MSAACRSWCLPSTAALLPSNQLAPVLRGRGLLTRIVSANKAAATHAAQHAKDGVDPITPASIGAAPGGFGLGSEHESYIADFNACIKNGWYRAYGNSLNCPVIGGWGARYGALLVSTRESAIYHVYYVNRYSVMYTLERYSEDGGTTWAEWEYVNPPMEPGVEYRTTERYLNKPVYIKVVDCGNVPAVGSSKRIIVDPNANIISVSALSTMRGVGIPYFDKNGVKYGINFSENDLIFSNYSETDNTTNALAIVKYLKTTQ